MKNFIKRPFLLITALSLVFIMTACGKAPSSSKFDEETIDKAAHNVIAIMQHSDELGLSQLVDADEEELQEFESWIKNNGLPMKGIAYRDGLRSYKEAVAGDLGEVVSVADKAAIQADDDSITSHIILTGTKTFPDGRPRTATTEIIMTKGGTVTSVVYNVDRTFGEKIINAALNTVLGMGTTFCLLIFISIVIWLMGTIVRNMEKSKTEARKKAESAADQVTQQIVEREEQNKAAANAAGDEALVAVISAAIAAYESEARGYNVTPDTFIVRSLRRR